MQSDDRGIVPRYTPSLMAEEPLPPLDPAVLHERRERVFLVMAGLFLGTLAMLNILGVTRFITFAAWGTIDGQSVWLWFDSFEPAKDPKAWTFAVAVGVLPYPVTFICTDLISEFYGRRRANFVVLVGLILNVWVMFILWLGGALPGNEAEAFYVVRKLAFGAVTASMIAYLAAQLVDVYVFHFWKRLTSGKHLWLRNNGSTLVSQAVDTVAVITITYAIGGLSWAIDPDTDVLVLLVVFIFTSYMFKLVAALVDTPLIYLAVWLLKDYLRIDPSREHVADAEESGLAT